MAFSAPIDRIQWDGYRGVVQYVAVVDGAGQDRADENLVDISALSPAPSSIKIKRVDCFHSGDFASIVEYDATTDQEVERFISQSDATALFVRDYCDLPNKGLLPTDTGAAGFTGDILLTTSGMAAGDELNLMIVFEKSTG